MSNIVPFKFENFSIRTVTTDDGEILFVAADVCDALDISKYRDAVARLDDDEGRPVIVDTLGGPQEMTAINESGLYSLILGSRKPEAKKFKKWVTSEVLPAIRKTGKYEAKDTFKLEPEPIKYQIPKSSIPATKEFRALFGIAKLLGLDKNAAAISANQATIKTMGTNMLALLGHTHLEASNQESLVFTPSELGLRMGLSGMKFNKLLDQSGLQTKEGDHWVPTESARGHYRLFDTGKKHHSGTPVQQLKWLDSVLPLVQQAA